MGCSAPRRCDGLSEAREVVAGHEHHVAQSPTAQLGQHRPPVGQILLAVPAQLRPDGVALAAHDRRARSGWGRRAKCWCRPRLWPSRRTRWHRGRSLVVGLRRAGRLIAAPTTHLHKASDSPGSPRREPVAINPSSGHVNHRPGWAAPVVRRWAPMVRATTLAVVQVAGSLL
jgi:hypothetical protein